MKAVVLLRDVYLCRSARCLFDYSPSPNVSFLLLRARYKEGGHGQVVIQTEENAPYRPVGCIGVHRASLVKRNWKYPYGHDSRGMNRKATLFTR